MKILCFSGTGNSLYLSKEIAKKFDGKILSIPQLLRDEIFEVEDEMVGIIFPIYYLDIPSMVHEYLSKVRIKSNYTFAILTYGMFAFNTKSFINRYNFKIDYTNEIKMIDNYVAFFDMKKSKNGLTNYEYSIESIVKEIENKKICNKTNNLKRTFGNFMHSFTKPKNIKFEDEKFYVNSNCTLCEVCKKACVANNIQVEDKVIYKNNCEQCMACIQLCPQNAIHHKNEKNDERYLNKNITLSEIISLNN